VLCIASNCEGVLCSTTGGTQTGNADWQEVTHAYPTGAPTLLRAGARAITYVHAHWLADVALTNA
jgi:hypothetical protein